MYINNFHNIRRGVKTKENLTKRHRNNRYFMFGYIYTLIGNLFVSEYLNVTLSIYDSKSLKTFFCCCNFHSVQVKHRRYTLLERQFPEQDLSTIFAKKK